MSFLGSGKTRLTLTQYTVTSGTVAINSAKSFTVMLNPADVSHDKAITYDATVFIGGLATEKKFNAYQPENFSFSVTIDGTGVVPPASATTATKDVMTQIADLCTVIYNYVGDKHEPSRVRVLWGTVIFFGRLQTLKTKYTLFKPSGDPLRATVDLAFVGTTSSTEAAQMANRSSPDLSHMVEVRQGDTLPLLCQRIYGDPGYYLDVARFNRLVDFRNLKPGGKLHFPPLE
jgi:nucleoid-associated protein YgaU